MRLLQAARMAAWRLGWRLRARRAGGLKVGDTFPDFSLRDVHGTVHRLSDRAETWYTVLWFTNFCDDCRARSPLLEELRREAGQRFRILAVSILGKDDPLPRQVAPSCGFPLLLDPDDIVALKLGLPHPPGTCPLHNLFMVSSSGTVLYRGHLSAMGNGEFKSLWTRLLQQGAEQPSSGRARR